jgi:hypothetical protein
MTRPVCLLAALIFFTGCTSEPDAAEGAPPIGGDVVLALTVNGTRLQTSTVNLYRTSAPSPSGKDEIEFHAQWDTGNGNLVKTEDFDEDDFAIGITVPRGLEPGRYPLFTESMFGATSKGSIEFPRVNFAMGHDYSVSSLMGDFADLGLTGEVCIEAFEEEQLTGTFEFAAPEHPDVPGGSAFTVEDGAFDITL